MMELKDYVLVEKKRLAEERKAINEVCFKYYHSAHGGPDEQTVREAASRRAMLIRLGLWE